MATRKQTNAAETEAQAAIPELVSQMQAQVKLQREHVERQRQDYLAAKAALREQENVLDVLQKSFNIPEADRLEIIKLTRNRKRKGEQ